MAMQTGGQLEEREPFMGKQKVRWKQSTKSGYSAKRAYHKEWRKWQKAVGEAKRLAMPIPQRSRFCG
jgi:hypothetical protein